jgi:hypothetical protein
VSSAVNTLNRPFLHQVIHGAKPCQVDLEWGAGLHTDEPHPHVHVALKARREQGLRLNIRKATLRNWRQQLATNWRELGVAANTTKR